MRFVCDVSTSPQIDSESVWCFYGHDLVRSDAISKHIVHGRNSKRLVREPITEEKPTRPGGRVLAASPYSLALDFLLPCRGTLGLVMINWCTIVSTPTSLKFEVRRTTGGVDSVVSSFKGVAAWLSFASSDSDGARAGSEDVASVVSTALASFGASASYSTLIRTTGR